MTKEYKFKKGDKVRLIQGWSDGANEGFNTGVLSLGDKYVIGGIDTDNCENGIEYPYFLDNAGCYNIEECMLELVEEAPNTDVDSFVLPIPKNNPPTPAVKQDNSASGWLKQAVAIQQERANEYDKEEERSAASVAKIFNILRNKGLTEADVFLLLQILKQVRYCQNFDVPHMDSLLDNVSYAALFAEAATRNVE